MSQLAKLREFRGTQIKPTYQTEKPKEDPRYEPMIAKVEKQEFKPFTPGLPFVPTAPTKPKEQVLPTFAKTTNDRGTQSIRESVYRDRSTEAIKEAKVEKQTKATAKENAARIEKEMEDKYSINIRKTFSPMDYQLMIGKLKLDEQGKKEFDKLYTDYLFNKERSNPFNAAGDGGFNILPTMTESVGKNDERFREIEATKEFGMGRFVGGAGQQLAFGSVLSAPIEGLVSKFLPKATPFITETIKDVAIGTGTQLAEAPFDKPTATQFVGNIAMDIALNALFGAVGKGLSKIDLTSLKSAKPQQVVQEVAKQMDINETQANDLIDRSIDVYVNQYGVADTKQFDQLQLEAPKNVTPEYKSDAFGSTLRNKTNDIYVNQFGVADTKPFEQLQLEAPVRTNSDAIGMRLSEKVKAAQEPKVEIEIPLIGKEKISLDLVNVTDEEIKSGLNKTIKYNPNLTVEARYSNGKIEVGNKYFELSNNSKPIVLTHEIAHSMTEELPKTEIDAMLEVFDDVYKNRVKYESVLGTNAYEKNYDELATDLLTKYIDNPTQLKQSYPEAFELAESLATGKSVKNTGIYKRLPKKPQIKEMSDLENQIMMIEDVKAQNPKMFEEKGWQSKLDELKKQVKQQSSLPQDFTIQKPQYPPLAKNFARETVTPKITPKLKPKAQPILQDVTIQKPTYPKMQPEFTKERPSVLQPGDIKPSLKADEVADPVLKKFRLDLFGATPEKPIKAIVEGKPVNVVSVKNNVATLSDGTNVAVKNVAMPKAKIEPTLNPKQVDFEKETLSAKTETVANGEIKERGFSENIRTDKNRVDELRQEFDQNKEFYETLSNKSTLESAQARFDRGYDEAIKDFRATSDTIRADNVPLAKLIADEATKRGDMEVAREVIVKAAESLTKAGQFSQAAKILRESNDPITIMQFVNKEIKKLNNQGSIRYGNKWDNIKLDENELDLIAKISKDATDEEKEEVFKQIFDSISKRIPTTKREQFDAWRRIAMLFNPKTHVRNTLGNTLMKGLKLISDKQAQAMELTLPKDIRTKGFATKELKETAKTYFDSNKKTLLEGSRWDIFGVASPFSEKQIFKNQFLESLNEISKKTLEGEDIFFFKSNFINDLAGFMNARGLKEPTEEAVQYALRRSQEATFRQANEVANAINKLKGSRIGLLVDAAIPFTKTPANILKTGIDYSPIGAMKSVVEILNKADPATAIENLSKGLTGTGLALIGAWASANGLARGDYEKKANVEGLYQATGMLPNSIKTPGGSYTIDWAQPIAMPFFMGVAFMDELKKGGQSKADAAFKALLQSGESLVNQSMLSGVKDLFGGYGTMTEKIIQLPINYMTQGFPTVGGQIARVIDPYKRQIDYSNIIGSTITSLQAKTPLLTKELPVKRDILGKPQEYGKGLLNVFQQFLSPGFIGKETDDPVIKEISRLYESVGSDVLPKAKVTDFSNEKIKYNLTTQEISEVQRIMGEYTNKQLLSLMNSYDYKNATDAERAKMVKKANETGYELAKKTIVEARKK